jgi:hypothetical protein
MAAALVTPDALKQIKPYTTLATQLEQKNEKAVAYYCLYLIAKFLSVLIFNLIYLFDKKAVYMLFSKVCP